jgi:hypothetical protein
LKSSKQAETVIGGLVKTTQFFDTMLSKMHWFASLIDVLLPLEKEYKGMPM